MHYTTHLYRHLRCTIGKNLREARSKQGLTMAKLAKESGIPAYMIDRYEMGKTDMRLHALIKLSTALNLPLATLFK